MMLNVSCYGQHSYIHSFPLLPWHSNTHAYLSNLPQITADVQGKLAYVFLQYLGHLSFYITYL